MKIQDLKPFWLVGNEQSIWCVGMTREQGEVFAAEHNEFYRDGPMNPIRVVEPSDEGMLCDCAIITIFDGHRFSQLYARPDERSFNKSARYFYPRNSWTWEQEKANHLEIVGPFAEAEA